MKHAFRSLGLSAVLLSVALHAAWALTLAVTGDVAAPDAGAVSDAILAEPSVEAVLLAGDTDNEKTTPLGSFQKLYKGTFDRFLSKIHPCPGNHDRSSIPRFSGYQAFWGEAAHAPEMYYSFDLGGWHIISLDSVTFEKGGPAARAQLGWLKTDLAAHPKAPVLAYWHYPFFSRAKHHGEPRMKPFWEALYAHGPALVMNGHNHVYERFAPMDPEGRTVARTRGIQEFVISPGGASPELRESEDASGPPPEKFDGGVSHVGFFILEPGGTYRYTVKAVTGKGPARIVDSGAGDLLGRGAPATSESR